MKGIFVVCGSRPWNRTVFDQSIVRLPGRWYFVATKDELTVAQLNTWKPDVVFFLHWSWIVPNEIIDEYECINFHMTDLPYGRGGSPLQNLILRGHTETKLTAHRMTAELDAGPVYLKEPLSLEGSAREILERSSKLAAHMIQRIITEHPVPKPQEGEPVLFARRTPEQSEIPKGLNDKERYDFIRMLDCEGYPRAFEIIDAKRVEYHHAKLHNGHLEAEKIISPSL